ncbi:hypothetical protein [Arenimonas sp.]|jgi:hypothetical protein|uniref:hypothetical protein n=1 Tax=Arenimonas sp. TaxID=1872635 RepID=UPI0037BE94EC
MFCTGCGKKISIEKYCSACGKLNHGHLANDGSIKHELTEQDKPISTNAYGPIIANQEVRALFVLGHDLHGEHLEWLKAKYPNSSVERFSTVGGVRQSAANLASQGAIDCLCLIGSSKSVPTCRISEGSHEIDLESDLFYASQRMVVDSVVDFQSERTFSKGVKYRESLARIGVDEIVGFVPVGRIPFDDFTVWSEYLTSLDRMDHGSGGEWIALSNFDSHWVNECEALFKRIGGEDFGHVFTIPDEQILIDGKFKDNGFKRSSRLVINLHGGIPNSGNDGQMFSTEYMPPQKHTLVDPSDYGPFPESIVFLFACFGGSSKWWNTGFIPKFFKSSGLSILASSNTVWVTDEDDFDCSKPSSVKLSAEFFIAIEKHGMPLGGAFSYAKQKVLADALQESDHRYFFKTLKEILQFSLYGAPWVVPVGRRMEDSLETHDANASGGRLAGGSVLGRVRSGGGLQSFRQKNTLLSEVRQRLKQSLGAQGVSYFGLNNSYFIDNLIESGRYAAIKHEVGVSGFGPENAKFGVLEFNGRSYVSGEIDAKGDGFNQKIMIFLDEDNQVVKTFKSKG